MVRFRPKQADIELTTTRRGSMQPERGPDVTKPRPDRRPRLADPDRVKLALDILAPKLEKAAQLGKIRSDIELLPDEALQQVGVIGQMVDDLRGRQSIIAQHLLMVAHLRALMRFALPGRTSICDGALPYKEKNKAEQTISSLAKRLLPSRRDASLEAIAREVR